MEQKITFTINGEEQSLYVDIRESLLEVVRDRLELTGTKHGCGVGECGACTVLINGEAFDSCIYMAVWADGKDIRTIEGESCGEKLSVVQTAFLEEGAVQCGFCTPGFIMTTTALTESGREFSRDDIKRELAGNMCRCTGYQNIANAAEKALQVEKECCGENCCGKH